MNFFKKQPTPKEAAMAAKREARREVRVSLVPETERILKSYAYITLWSFVSYGRFYHPCPTIYN